VLGNGRHELGSPMQELSTYIQKSDDIGIHEDTKISLKISIVVPGVVITSQPDSVFLGCVMIWT
jgi:hypothetical protein